jgi:type VI secretion system protein ImpM
MSESVQVGFFGKLPVLGDFLSRRLGPDFVEPWDQWLQQAMHMARAQAGGAWNELYTQAAPWRFALEAGVCGGSPVLGVLLPSNDRVGRQFPLTVACPLPTGLGALEVAAGSEAWFAATEALLERAVGGAMDVADFDLAVTDLAATLVQTGLTAPAAADFAMCQQYLLAHGAFKLPLPAAGIGASLAAMCARQLARTAPPLALFWCEATTAEPQMLASRSMPGPQLLAELLRLPARAPVASLPLPSVAADPPPPAADPLQWHHAVISRESPRHVHAVIAVAGTSTEDVDARLASLDALLARESVDENFSDELSALLGPDAQQDLRLAPLEFAVFMPVGDSHAFFWSSGATVFRLRGRDLERLMPEAAPVAGGSLLDLLQSTDVPAGAARALQVMRISTIDPADSYLLCADASYPSLSWGQLVSALDEGTPQYGIERLIEALGERAAAAGPALILKFQGQGEGAGAQVAHTLQVSDAAAA